MAYFVFAAMRRTMIEVPDKRCAVCRYPTWESGRLEALEKIRSVPITRVQITTYITDVSAERHALAPTLNNASETL